MKKIEIARKNIDVLLRLMQEYPNLKKRYLDLIKRISLKYRIRIRKYICLKCGAVKTARIKNKKIIRYCAWCDK